MPSKKVLKIMLDYGLMSIKEYIEKIKAEADKAPRYFTLRDGESVEGELIDLRSGEGGFGKRHEVVLRVSGMLKILTTRSDALILAIGSTEVKQNDKIKITRHGTRYNVSWTVEKLS